MDRIENIKITVLDKEFYIQEPSFYFCKNLIKNLNNTDNSEKVFNKVVKQLTGEVLNLQEKFLFLLELRGLILGNEIEITSNKINYKFDINDIIEKFSCKKNVLNYEGINFYYVNNMYNTSYSHELVFNSVLDCENIEEIPPLNFIDIYDILLEKFYNENYTFSKTNIKLNLLTGMDFIRQIYDLNLMDLYKQEYYLRKFLHLNSPDLDTISFPECKILLNYHIKDMKDIEDQQKKLKNNV
tara:strand:+ start:424 stop:1146 length:723 start_codon:yes stop_codon:yes gene_type:complete